MGFVAAAIFFGWIGGIIWSADRWLQTEEPVWGILAAVLLVGGFGLLLQAVIEAEAQGPCLRYETGQHWNGKFMQTYRHCVERGEWQE